MMKATFSTLVSLGRALSKLGLCSRSQGEQLIAAGRVRVNGAIAHAKERRVRLGRDRIEVDTIRVTPAQKTYLVLNKPRGLVTTSADEQGRGTVYDCLAGSNLPWVIPVGRLDKASEGLLLLTNDTRWADRVAAPATHLDKTYHVQVRGLADAAVCRQMVQGVTTPDGDHLAAKAVQPLRQGKQNSWLAVVLDEGKNRQIRRLLEALGYPVLRLIRVAIGPLLLGELAKGSCRPLTPAEKQAIDEALLKSCEQ